MFEGAIIAEACAPQTQARSAAGWRCRSRAKARALNGGHSLPVDARIDLHGSGCGRPRTHQRSSA